MNNRFAGLSKCVCKTPVLQTNIEGICTACYGRVSNSKSSRVYTPTLAPSKNSEILPTRPESSSSKRVKQPQISRSSSNLSNSVFHKRSQTSNNSNSPNEDLNSRKPFKSSDISNESLSFHSNQFVFSANSSPPEGKTSRKTPDQQFWKHFSSISEPLSIVQPVLHAELTSRSKYFQEALEFKNLPRHDRALSSRLYNANFSSISEMLQNSSFQPSRLLHGVEWVHKGHNNAVNDVVLIQNKAFTCGSDYKIIAWPRLGQRISQKMEVSPLATFKGHTRKVKALEAMPNAILISAGCEKRIRIWNVNRDFRNVASLRTGGNIIEALCHLAEQTFVSASGAIDVWDLTAGSVVHSYNVVSSLSLAKLSSFTFLAGLSSGDCKLFDLRNPHPIMTYPQNLPVTSILTWDDRLFYTASEELYVKSP
jgi:hypothetical protein